MSMKTIALTGAETAVTGLAGLNAAIRNDGTDVIYAANQPGITPGADEVLSIPAGGAAVLPDIKGTVYLSGTGSVMMITSDRIEIPFKPAAQSGSGADQTARAAIAEHENNTAIHVTASKKAEWNGKTTIAEAAQTFSNPNLLINPDLRNPVNQRGKSGVVSTAGYFIDRWKLVSGTAEITANGIVLNGTMKQILEYAAGANATASASAGTASYDNAARTFTLTAAGETIAWAKLEIGGIATLFCPPDPAAELAKCQRYYQKIIVPMNGFIPAAQFSGDLGKAVCSMNMPEKRTNIYSVTASAGGRVVLGSGIYQAAGYGFFGKSTDGFGVEITLDKATPSACSGWIDTFTLEIDAEL